MPLLVISNIKIIPWFPMVIKQSSKGQLLLELMIVTRLKGMCWYVHNSWSSVMAMAVSSCH